MNKTEESKDVYQRAAEAFLVLDYTLIMLYVLVFMWALIANILVIMVVLKYEYMRSVTNYFLVNLSIADLLVTLVCMPNAAYRAYTQLYYFGEYMCKSSGYLQCISVASSIFTITAMAIDRYLAITKPFGFFFRCFNKTTTLIVIVVLWLVSFILFFPQMGMIKYHIILYSNISKTALATCTEHWEENLSRKTLGIIWFVFMFVVPGVIMTFAYTMMGRTLCSVTPPFDNNEGMSSTQQRNRVVRSRKRVAIILLLLAFVFAACWLPYHIVNLLMDINHLEPNTEISSLQQYLLLLGHTNSALNPIIYCALSRKFRDSIKDLCFVRIRFRRNRTLMHVDSSGSATQLHYLTRLRSVPTANNQFNFGISRLPSSQKITKTCAV